MPSLFKRINDVINANINDLIDRVEDPERMVKQIIREMEENIRVAKDGVINAIASEKQLLKDLEHHRRQAQEWEKKAEVALQTDKDDLARTALLRKKEHDQIIKTLAPSWESAKHTSERLKTQLRSLEAKLEEARRKRGALIARQRAAEARQHMDHTLSSMQAGLDAHTNFARMEDRVAEMEARTEAMEEVNDTAAQMEKDFLAMEIDTEVDRELAALKKKIQGETEAQ